MLKVIEYCKCDEKANFSLQKSQSSFTCDSVIQEALTAGCIEENVKDGVSLFGV